MSTETKHCPKCKIDRPIIEFYKSVRDQRTSYCRHCMKRKMATVGALFSFGKARAKNRKVEWGLTKDEFIALRAKPCTYCDGPLPTHGAGLDRIDPLIGYTPANAVPCCALCNHLKHSNLAFDEMTDLIGPAVKQIRKRRGLGPNEQLLMHHQKHDRKRVYRGRRKGGIAVNGHLTSLPARSTDERQ